MVRFDYLGYNKINNFIKTYDVENKVIRAILIKAKNIEKLKFGNFNSFSNADINIINP